MLPNVEALGRQLVVDGPVGDDLPWPAIEEKWEIAFPDDYKEFLGLYGAGTFAGYLAVMAPFPEDHEAYKAGIRMAPPDSELLDELCCPFPAHPAPGGVFAIGATPGGDTLLYRTAQQPADWRIVTWSRDRRSPRSVGPNTSWASPISSWPSCTPNWRKSRSAHVSCGAPRSSRTGAGTLQGTDSSDAGTHRPPLDPAKHIPANLSCHIRALCTVAAGQSEDVASSPCFALIGCRWSRHGLQ